MKNDTTFVRMRSGGHRGNAKKCQKRYLASSNLSFQRITIDKNVFAEWKKKGRSKKVASKLLIFVPGLRYDLSKFSDEFTQLLRLWKTII